MSRASLAAGDPCTSNVDDSTSSYSLSNKSKIAAQLELSNPVLWLSGGFLTLFVMLALIDTQLLTSLVNSGFGYATQYFGGYWQILMLANFLIGLYLAFGQTGYVRLGSVPRPEIGTFKWLSILLCTLLAGGGVFWAAAEPLLTMYLRRRCLVKLNLVTWQSMRYRNPLCTGAFLLGQF